MDIVTLGLGSTGTRLRCADQTLSPALAPSEPLPVRDLA